MGVLGLSVFAKLPLDSSFLNLKIFSDVGHGSESSGKTELEICSSFTMIICRFS